MVDLTLVVIGANAESLRQFGTQHIGAADFIPVSNEAGEPLATIANRFLDASSRSIFGLAHADCIFNAGSLDAFAAAARESVCGIVGITRRGRYRWCWRDPAEVETLDSCSVFFSKRTGLRFDERVFDGFHCHVQDLCLEAERRKIPVVVPAADATHIGLNFDQPKWRADYEWYKAKLVDKWGRLPQLT